MLLLMLRSVIVSMDSSLLVIAAAHAVCVHFQCWQVLVHHVHPLGPYRSHKSPTSAEVSIPFFVLSFCLLHTGEAVVSFSDRVRAKERQPRCCVLQPCRRLFLTPLEMWKFLRSICRRRTILVLPTLSRLDSFSAFLCHLFALLPSGLAALAR